MRTDFNGTSANGGYQSSTPNTTPVPITIGDRFTFVIATRNWSQIKQYSVYGIID
jgi:hypothetical protein